MIVTGQEKLYSNYNLNIQILWCGICHTLGLHRRESPLCFDNEVEITVVQILFYTAITRTGVIILVLRIISCNKDFSSLTKNLRYKGTGTAK